MEHKTSCCKCHKEVVFDETTTEGYLCWCPNCDEDLDYYEVYLGEHNGLSLKRDAASLGITTVKQEDGSYVGVHNRILSDIPFSDPIQAYWYSLDTLENKPLTP